MKKNNKTKVFVIGPITKDHGQGRVTDYTWKILKTEYQVKYLNTHIKNFNIYNKILRSVCIIFIIIIFLIKFVILKSNIIIYFTPSRNLFSSLKDFILLFFVLIFKIWKKNIHVIGHLHGSDLLEFLKKNLYGKLLSKLYNSVIDKLIINSENHKSYALGKNFQKYKIINNPIEISSSIIKKIDHKKPYEHGKINITFISVPSKEKGLFESISLIEKIFFEEDWKLNVIGWDKNSYNKIYIGKPKFNAKTLNKILFLGKISDKRKFEILLNSNLFILLSFKEAQPLTVIEAGIFKCCMILSEIDMLLEFKKFKSILYNNNQLTKKHVLKLIGSDEKLTDTSKSFILNHSFKTYHKNIVEAFKI